MFYKTLAFIAAPMIWASLSVGAMSQTLPSGQVQIIAEKMCCKGCVQKISGQLYTVKGVKSVGADLSTHTVSVTLPEQSPPALGSLWDAVHKGDGGPTRLMTDSATYELVLPTTSDESEQVRRMGTKQHLVIENLHCMDCARKIASHLYTIKGVTKVGVDMQSETLVVETASDEPISPWLAIDAATKANERPIAVSGNFGTLSIKWNEALVPKDHQATQPNIGGNKR